jgi:hypothetical protein
MSERDLRSFEGYLDSHDATAQLLYQNPTSSLTAASSAIRRRSTTGGKTIPTPPAPCAPTRIGTCGENAARLPPTSCLSYSARDDSA